MGIIRLLLALCVVAGHSGSFFGLKLVSGDMAVQAFYIISGFYMSLILTEKYVGKNSSYRLFISNRFLRLYPVYWAVLILSVGACFVVALLTPDNNHLQLQNYFGINWSPGSLIFLVLSNILVFGQDVVMFLGINPSDGHLFFTPDFRQTSPQLYTFLFIWQAWTLGLELMFYLVAPFLLRRGLVFIIVCMVASLLLRAHLYYNVGLTNDPWTYRFFPTELVFFLAGNISYRIYKKIQPIAIPQVINIGIFAFILLFTLTFFRIPNWLITEFPRRVLYYIAILVIIPVLFKMFKKNKLDGSIGELSYPVYISHMLIVLVVWQLNLVNLKHGVVVAILSIMLSILLNRFIANPVEQYRQSRVKKLPVVKNGEVASATKVETISATPSLKEV